MLLTAKAKKELKEEILSASLVQDRSPFDVNGIKLYVFQSVEYLYKLTMGDLEIQLEATKNEIPKVAAKIKLIDASILMLSKEENIKKNSMDDANSGVPNVSPSNAIAIKLAFLAVIKAKFERLHLYLNQRIPRLERIQKGFDHLRLITTSESWQQYVNPAFMYSYSLKLLGAIVRTLVDTMPVLTIAYFTLYLSISENMPILGGFYGLYLVAGILHQGENYKKFTHYSFFAYLFAPLDLILRPIPHTLDLDNGIWGYLSYYTRKTIWVSFSVGLPAVTAYLLLSYRYSRYIYIGLVCVCLSICKLSDVIHIYDSAYVLLNLSLAMLFTGSTKYAAYFVKIAIAAVILQVLMTLGKLPVILIVLALYFEAYSYYVKRSGYNVLYIASVFAAFFVYYFSSFLW